MDEIINLIKSPVWWFGSIFIALIVGAISNQVSPQIFRKYFVPDFKNMLEISENSWLAQINQKQFYVIVSILILISFVTAFGEGGLFYHDDHGGLWGVFISFPIIFFSFALISWGVTVGKVFFVILYIVTFTLAYDTYLANSGGNFFTNFNK